MIKPKIKTARQCLKQALCTLYTLVAHAVPIRVCFDAHPGNLVVPGVVTSVKKARSGPACSREFQAHRLLWQSIVLAICLIAHVTAHAQQAPILAAASSLRILWPALMDSYTEDTGEPEPKVSFGSSGLLSTQIINGAPFEIFLSADQQSIERIPKEHLLLSPEVFAQGALQLAVPANSALAKNLSIDSLAQALDTAYKSETSNTAEPAVFRIAVPNPVHAPYGRAAQEALEQAQQWPLPEGALVAAENAAQTLQFLRTGAVSAALLPQALLHNNTEGLVSVEVPSHSYQPVEHVLAILKSDNNSAGVFGRWLLGEQAQHVLHNSGLQVDLQ